MDRRKGLIALALVLGLFGWLKIRIDNNQREAARVAQEVRNQDVANETEKAPVPTDGSGASLAGAAGRTLTDRLVAKGWTRKDTQVFAKLNEQLFGSEPDSEADSRLIERLGSLTSLRDHSRVFDQLQESPELVALLAWVHDPDALFKAWNESSPAGRIILEDVLLIETDRLRASDIIRGWKRHGAAITETWQRGLVGTEAVLIRPVSDEADKAFDNWTEALFKEIRQLNAQEVASRLMLIIDEGPELRRLLRDLKFRRSFESHWSKLLRIKSSAGCPLGELIRHPHIWDLLDRPDGIELATAYGTIPADLLFGKSAYRSEVQPRVIRLLKSRMLVAFETLRREDLREDERYAGQFLDLLRRETIPDEILLKICVDLQASAVGPGPVFERIVGKSEAELADLYKEKIDMASWDDNLPGYLKVPRRWLAGMPLDNQDINRALVDAVFDAANTAVAVGGALTGVPTDTANELISKTKEGANLAIDAKAKSELDEQKQRLERVVVPVLNQDSKKFFDEGLARVRADQRFSLSEKLRAILIRFQDDRVRGDASANASWRIFYAIDKARAPIHESLEKQGLMLRFTSDHRLYIAPKSDVTTAYSTLKRADWARQASRRWIERIRSE